MYNILCVDDIESNLFILESLFEPYKDKYNLITAISGEDALGILLEKNIDIILLDVMMPGLDGFETAKLIKANKLTKDIPIIFLTAKRDEETIKNAFNYGVEYLSKPYDEFELFTRIEVQLKLLDANKKVQEQILFNQAILDASKNIIFIQDDYGVVSANQSFLEFFQVKSVEEFNKAHESVMELFMEYDNFFSKHILNDGESWLNELSHNGEKEYNILIMNIETFEPHVFQIYVTPIDHIEKFVVTLSDVTKLTTKSKQFEIKATYDPLTNIYNRSKFNDLLDEHYNLFKRYNEPLCFAIFDIDFFKKVNDTYGHVVGDETLIKFANTINDMVRTTDVFARWGGEEFTLLMPHTNIDDGFEVVNKIRKVIENVTFKTIGQKTCSIGITQFTKDDTIDSILIRADEALYEAKESGRNKVCRK